ncbi:hypothetical protein, partial [Nocardioides psychrotolerans]|uniref:hypothetical protein n=1 Tax=Nocardioides psychrotolerans TaxID=1005945 RepID=UPI0031378C0D
MSHLRSRMAALTCAAAVALPLAGSATATAAATGATSSTPATTSLTSLRATHVGLDRLLAAGTYGNRAIVTFDSVPSGAEVAALRALGLVVQP